MNAIRRAVAAVIVSCGACAATGAHAASETFFLSTPLTYTFSVDAAGSYNFSTWAAALGYTSQLFAGNSTTGSALATSSSSVIGRASFDADLSLGTNYTFKLTSVLPSTTLAIVKLTGPGYVQAALPPVAAVPEPETYAMLLAGVGVMGLVARRRNQKNRTAQNGRTSAALEPALPV